jgi:TolB protein
MQRLTHDGRQKMDPVFVTGGSELVFTIQEHPTQLSIMRCRLADGSMARLHPQATTSEFEAAFSADGRYCAFVQNRANLSLKLVIRDTKEDKDAIFDPGGGFAGMHRPTVAPDNSRVAFSIPALGGQQIASVNLQGRDRKYLTQVGLNNWPAFSPDGKEIAFGSSRDGHFEIYLMDSAGNAVRRLTRSQAMNMRPAWSPDGRRLAFTSNRDGNYEIYVVNADGTGLARVTYHPDRDDYTAWHPDGKHLVTVSERGGQSDLYLLEAPA